MVRAVLDHLVSLADDVDVSRGNLLADPDRAPIVARELEARVCWMSERALEPRARLAVKHTTRSVRAIAEELVALTDIHSLEDVPGPGRLQLNDIGVALSRETDISRLLETILVAAKNITNADGGTLVSAIRVNGAEGNDGISVTQIFDVGLGSSTTPAFSPSVVDIVDGKGSNNITVTHGIIAILQPDDFAAPLVFNTELKTSIRTGDGRDDVMEQVLLEVARHG